MIQYLFKVGQPNISLSVHVNCSYPKTVPTAGRMRGHIIGYRITVDGTSTMAGYLISAMPRWFRMGQWAWSLRNIFISVVCFSINSILEYLRYGIEFVADFQRHVNGIQIVVNNPLWSHFRAPIKLPRRCC